MAKGISIFLGLDSNLEDNLLYIKKANNLGFSKIFTSLHIPEANYRQISAEFKQMVAYANDLNMQIIADISPNAYSYLGFDIHDLKTFKSFGLHGIRLDYGFKPYEIANYTNNDCDLLIELNASTITEDFLSEIVASGANLNNISACHNYYPRKNTGISLASMKRKNQLFKAFNVPVSGFVALQHHQRGPLFEGLPTLEFTRNMLPIVAWQLLNLNGIDNVFFGDCHASDSELASIANLTTEIIHLPCVSFNQDEKYQTLLSCVHTNRPDAAEDVIRSQESRLNLLHNINVARAIEPDNCIARGVGAITIDNLLYQRYSGEMQICKKLLNADDRVNVIGQVAHDAICLFDFIGDNTKYLLMLA